MEGDCNRRSHDGPPFRGHRQCALEVAGIRIRKQLFQEARHVAVGAQDEFELSSAHRLAQLISQRQADLDLRGRGSDRQPRRSG